MAADDKALARTFFAGGRGAAGMVHSQTPMQARNRKAMRGGAEYPTALHKPSDARLNDTQFVDALCGTVAPLLARRSLALSAAPCGGHDHVSEARADPLHAYRVEEFVQLLLDENDNGCEDFAFRQAASGADPQRMAADYLGPAARLIGDFWRMDICDFMQVTVCMSRIQRLFWRLVEEYPPVGETRVGCSILLSPVPGEQHGFGQSVVEDAFRRQGWHVDSCSFDEEDDLYAFAESNEYQVIGLSVSGEPFLPLLAAAILKLRRRSRNAGVSIMVGGSLVATHPDAARGAGADLLVRDVAEALDLAEASVAAGAGRTHIVCASG